MRLNEWWYTNQDDTTDKADAQRLVAYLLGYHEISKRKPVMVQNSEMLPIDEIIPKIRDDGFPEWADYWREGEHVDPVHTAVTWTRLRYLKEIADGDKNVALLTDNLYPTVPLYYLREILEDVPDTIYGLNLSFRREKEFVEFAKKQLMIRKLWNFEDYTLYNSYIVKGFYFMFTPKGAARYLELWRQIPHVHARDVLWTSYTNAKAKKKPFLLHKWWSCYPDLQERAANLTGRNNMGLSRGEH